jgi:hypothetical protein
LRKSRRLSHLIEHGIRPLVDAFNELGFARTIYSCEGHFNEKPREKFLPTAYVTFGVSDVAAFSRLYDWICTVEKDLRKISLRLTYDCIVGRYTLSLWADASIRNPARKRMLVDAACRDLSEAILKHTGVSVGSLEPRSRKGPNKNLPCSNEYVPPCLLVIPPKFLNCPFAGITGDQPENSR